MRSVVPLRARDLAAGVGAVAAEVEVLDRRPVVRPPGQWPARHDLLRHHFAEALHGILTDIGAQAENRYVPNDILEAVRKMYCEASG